MLELPMEKAKKPTVSAEKKAGRYLGFKKLVSKLKEKGLDTTELEKSFKEVLNEEIEKAVKDPAALAAFIGRKKYGKEKYAKMSTEGKKKK